MPLAAYFLLGGGAVARVPSLVPVHRSDAALDVGSCHSVGVRRSHHPRLATRSMPGPLSRSESLGCNTYQTVALDIVRRPKTTLVHDSNATCAARTARGFAAIRSSAAIWVALRATKNDPPSTWWPDGGDTRRSIGRK